MIKKNIIMDCCPSGRISMRKCSKCGNECADDVAFCTACGNPMNAEPEAPAEAAAPAEEAPKAEGAQQEAQAAPKKPIEILEKFKAMSNKSKIMLGGICAVALLLIIGIKIW